MQIKEYNISLCIDIRHPISIKKKPSAFENIEGVEYINIGYSDGSNAIIAERLDNEDFDADEWTNIYIDIIEKERTWVRKNFKKISRKSETFI